MSETKVRDLIQMKFISFKGWIRYIDYDNPNSEYNKLVQFKRPKYTIQSPEREIVEFDSITKFAKKIGIDRHTLSSVLTGKTLITNQGWHLPGKEKEIEKHKAQISQKLQKTTMESWKNINTRKKRMISLHNYKRKFNAQTPLLHMSIKD